MGKTLLTQGCEPPTESGRQKGKVPYEALEACRAILQATIDAYVAGELTLEKAIEMATRAANAQHLPKGFQRQKMLGAFMQALFNTTQKKRTRESSRTRPDWLKTTAIELVNMVAIKEGLPKTRLSKTRQTAYERTSEIFRMRGITISAREIERFYTEKRD